MTAMGKDTQHTLMTEIPKDLHAKLQKLGVAPLFAPPPKP